MNYKIQFVMSVFISMLICSLVYAAQETINVKNDNDNYTGDRLSFPVNVNAKYTGADDNEYGVCIPAKTTLRGLGRSHDNKIHVRLATFLDDVDDCSKESKIPKNVAMRIAIDDIAYKPNRYGLTYGALFVPYKYHFSGSKEFNSDSTIGPFMGYRFDANTVGFGVKLIGFLGGSMISVIDDNNKTQSLAGFSYGIGIIGELKNDFQLGMVLGQDRVSDGSNYEDNGKWWGAIALGFSFAN